MNRISKYIIGGICLVVAIFSCTPEELSLREVPDGATFKFARETWNQNDEDLLDSVQHHTTLIQAINFDAIEDTTIDHRTGINYVVLLAKTDSIRTNYLYTIDHSHTNSSILNATTASYTTGLGSTISGHTTSISNLNDSIARHNCRLKALENGGGGGTGDVSVSGTTTANYSAVWNGTDSTLVSRNTMIQYVDSVRVNQEIHAYDSIRMNYAKPLLPGTRFVVVTTGAAQDTGVLNTVSRGLTDPLWDVHKQLADTVNKEIPWYHVDDKTGKIVKTHGLPNGMDAFEALQYTSEMSLRLIADQDLRTAKLERDIRIFVGIVVFLVFVFGFSIILIKKK